jgi:hypothetical protein
MYVGAWILGTIVLTVLWGAHEWQADGALRSFGHEGADGQWNPTLWALGVGVWGLTVGILALRSLFERPVLDSEIERVVRQFEPEPIPPTLWHLTRAYLERIGRLKFHVSACALGMVILTPLWAMIEWQDNGGFERFGNDSQPGEWEPWFLYIGGIWALVIAIFALRVFRAGRRLRKVARRDRDLALSA